MLVGDELKVAGEDPREMGNFEVDFSAFAADALSGCAGRAPSIRMQRMHGRAAEF
jgi:hypothetical protein